MTTAGIRVCVIGAGAAGLCACRHLSKDVSKFCPTVFEQTDKVGGTWVYTDYVGSDADGLAVHSSMYKSLKTNLPKEVMAFPDFPFQSNDKSFLHHSKVRAYLQDYCDYFGLNKYIEYRTLIKNVRPEKTSEDKLVWAVTHEEVKTGKTTTSTFDAVMVCNGHYSVPKIPDLQNLVEFEGLKMHSHDYRNPDLFKNMQVIVLGAAASGTDIGLEVATKANKVYLCHNGPTIPSKLPDNIVQVPGVVSAEGSNSFRLSDNSLLEVDAILFCTGYEFTFPFLDSTCNVTVDSQQVNPLFKHLIHSEFPSLCFIGIPFQVCPFPQFDIQVRLFVNTLTGKVILPSREEMNKDTEEEKERKTAYGIPRRHFHKMGEMQWAYNQELAEMAKISGIPGAVETLYNDVTARRRLNLTSYKEDSYKLKGDAYVRCEPL